MANSPYKEGMNETPAYILKLTAFIFGGLSEIRVLSERIERLEQQAGIPPLDAEQVQSKLEQHRNALLEALEISSPELAAHLSQVFEGLSPDSSTE